MRSVGMLCFLCLLIVLALVNSGSGLSTDKGGKHRIMAGVDRDIIAGVDTDSGSDAARKIRQGNIITIIESIPLVF